MTDNPTLETLESKLQRLIKVWKEAHNDPAVTGYESTMIINDELAEFVALHPELLTTQPPAYYSPDGLEGALIPQLLALPDEIRRLQESYDELSRGYEAEVSFAMLKALDEPRFTDKKGEVQSAQNETERKIAIDFRLSHDNAVIIADMKRADALRALQQAKTRLECARLIIQLVCKDGKR